MCVVERVQDTKSTRVEGAPLSRNLNERPSLLFAEYSAPVGPIVGVG